jgi:hypothetical protein
MIGSSDKVFSPYCVCGFERGVGLEPIHGIMAVTEVFSHFQLLLLSALMGCDPDLKYIP